VSTLMLAMMSAFVWGAAICIIKCRQGSVFICWLLSYLCMQQSECLYHL
jgi:hypothetical protein